ncbi:MAG: 4-hydroxybenzoate octaprenyltransferase [Phycisphaerales bacterium]|nr:4-hydroxybenzoate octaprenyltransferase [Phycisphaerales bacterium]
MSSSLTASSGGIAAGGTEPVRGAAAIRAVAGDIKLSHSVFAMPFAVLGAFLARSADESWGRFVGKLGLVVVCMVIARTWAMVVNRLADRKIDAVNPRTRRRAFASGRLSAGFGGLVLVGCAALFAAACSGFYFFFGNAWPVVLAIPVLGFLALYSFTKRFTWLCHLFVGLALAISPIAAMIAIDPSALGRVQAVYWLAGMVAVWVAGFDVIYSLQDIEIDQRDRLWSIPSRLGAGAAIWISRVLHVLAFAGLLMAWRVEPRLGWIFGAALVPVAGLLIAEHIVLASRGKAGLDMAFFTLNGVVSCVLGVAGCIDLVVN